MVTSGVWYLGEQSGLAIDELQDFRRICDNFRLGLETGFLGRVLQTGEPQWIDEIANSDEWQRGNVAELGLDAVIAFPVFVGTRVVAILEFFSKVAAKRESTFLDIMPDVGLQLGHVIQRKQLERDIADASEKEQRRIGRDIHDGVGQEITGLKYLAQTHAELLERQQLSEADLAKRLAAGFAVIQGQLRRIIRDLVPIELDSDGLAVALRSLAERTTDDHGVDCHLVYDESISLPNNLLSTHLYRIAQEAVVNAVTHANASSIELELHQEDKGLRLSICDDGIGIAGDMPNNHGIGLRSMQYRAELLGGTLLIESRLTGGTAVKCLVPRSSDK
jgi:signal transduction histidine kinase